SSLHAHLTPPSTTSTLSLHDALPIFAASRPAAAQLISVVDDPPGDAIITGSGTAVAAYQDIVDASIELKDGRFVFAMEVAAPIRSEEHTSELQSRSDIVCRLLLEKKK